MLISIEITIGAPPERVFAALTAGTSLWWGAPYIQSRHAQNLILELRLGGRFYESWSNDGNDREGALLGTVVALRRPTLLKLQGGLGMADSAYVSTVTFRLERVGETTQMSVTHGAFGHITDELEKRYAEGWTQLLQNLKTLVEMHRGGRGLRDDPTLYQ